MWRRRDFRLKIMRRIRSNGEGLLSTAPSLFCVTIPPPLQPPVPPPPTPSESPVIVIPPAVNITPGPCHRDSRHEGFGTTEGVRGYDRSGKKRGQDTLSPTLTTRASTKGQRTYWEVRGP